MNTKQISVWVAVIQHKHGQNVYVATSVDAIQEDVAQFCRDWWATVVTDHEDPGTYEKLHGREAMIHHYFNTENEFGGIENADITYHTIEVSA